MRVIIYDAKPGSRFIDKFLKLSWLVAAWFQKLIGVADAVYAAETWLSTVEFLSRHDKLTSLQYWGHGSPGTVWLSGHPLTADDFRALKGRMAPEGIIWFRCCSVFQGLRGHRFSEQLANELNCTIAGHTRVIGVFQGGLHTRKPYTAPSWPIEEVEFPFSMWSYLGLKWGNNTVVCLATKVPSGW